MDSYIIALMTVYSPATNESDATHWFSTEDVYEAIKKIDPGTSVSLEDVYNSLLMGGSVSSHVPEHWDVSSDGCLNRNNYR